jgi:peptide/nickel transport system substrate-binding protein
VTTSRPNAVLPGQLTNIFIVSKAIATGASTADFQSGRAAIGTGPFKVVSYTRGGTLELARNERYWGPKPAWATVSIKVISNDASRVAALMAGDLDIADDIAPSYVAQLEHTKGIAAFKHASDRVMFLEPTVRTDQMDLLTDNDGKPLPHNPLRDIRVRRAMSLAMDRKAMTERAFDGQAIPATQLVPPGFGAYDPSLPVLPYDPAAAKKLLAEAGYPQGFGMTIACTNDRYVADEKVCQVAGQMLERIGLHMKVETLPGNILLPRARPENNIYPLLYVGQSNSASRDPTHVLSLALHSFNDHGEGTSNRGGFKDPALDAAIEAAVSRLDEGREEALHAAMMQGIDEGVVIPLFVQTVVVAARNGITYAPRMDEQTVAQNAVPPP